MKSDPFIILPKKTSIKKIEHLTKLAVRRDKKARKLNKMIPESWHYKRKCEKCGGRWFGLHCIHDGYQNPCPHCNTVPMPVPMPEGGCNCKMVEKDNPKEKTARRKWTYLRVTRATKNRLSAEGLKSQTYDDIINQLINENAVVG
jgi:hypothetical protein